MLLIPARYMLFCLRLYSALPFQFLLLFILPNFFLDPSNHLTRTCMCLEDSSSFSCQRSAVLLHLVSLFRVCSADVSILLSECELSWHGTYVFLTVVSIRSIWFYPRLGLCQYESFNPRESNTDSSGLSSSSKPF